MRISSIGMPAVMVLTLVGFGPDRSSTSPSAEALRLPKSLAEYTKDRNGAEEFLAFVRKRHWNGNERPRKCHQSENCTGNDALLLIEEAEGAEGISFTTYNSPTEILVGRVENTGKRKDILFGDDLPPDPKAEGFVFLSRSKGKAVPHFVRLYFKDGIPHLDDKGYAADEFHKCDNDGPSGKTDADFKDCPHMNARRRGDSTARPLDSSDGIAWFSCAEGCCGSSFPPFSRKKPVAPKPKPRPKS